jgi:osmotically-inducible protein OsmY
MSRDRQPSWYGRYPQRQDWEREREREPRYRAQERPHDYEHGADRRYPEERDYGARHLAEESRRYPSEYGQYDDDPQRVRRFDPDSDHSAYEQRAPQGDYAARHGRYGSGRNLDTGWSSEAQRYGQRDTQQTRYGQGAWGEREDTRDHGRERAHEGLGQQLRDAGQQMMRKVKRAFRGPKGYKRSDERIREDVNDRLSEQDHFDPSEIEVAVANSEVTLTGTVQSRHEKFLAEEIADDVNGVLDVHNQLRVRREPTQQAVSGTDTTLPGTGAAWPQRRNNA